MNSAYLFRVGLGVAGLLGVTVALSGCVGGPTYGTDKTAMEQLVDDVGSAVSIAPREPANKGTKYNPRPDLVLPPGGTQTAGLVAPQASVASRDSTKTCSPSVPESVVRPRSVSDCSLSAAGRRLWSGCVVMGRAPVLRDGVDSIVLIEHDMGVVMDISDRVVVLDYGRKIGDGVPDEVRSNEAVVAAYLGVSH